MAENKEERAAADEAKEQVVTPWEAKAGEGQATIDYDKLISEFRVATMKIFAKLF